PLDPVWRCRQRGRQQQLRLPALVCAVVLWLTTASGSSSLWRSGMAKQAKNTICIWYDGGAEDAARFYARTFPDSSVGAVHLAPGDFPSGKKGDVLTVEFTVMG